MWCLFLNLKQNKNKIFYDIGAYLFNAMMKRTDLSASRSIAVKLELSAFDSWPENPPAIYKDVLRHVVGVKLFWEMVEREFCCVSCAHAFV